MIRLCVWILRKLNASVIINFDVLGTVKARCRDINIYNNYIGENGAIYDPDYKRIRVTNKRFKYVTKIN